MDFSSGNSVSVCKQKNLSKPFVNKVKGLSIDLLREEHLLRLYIVPYLQQEH
jgi:hypothetical protein